MTFRVVRGAASPHEARRLIAAALPPVVTSVLQATELEALRQRLLELPEPPARAGLSREDWAGGLGIFRSLFSSTLPVVIPFVVMRSAVPALRVSNAIAIAMLFVAGFVYGRQVGRSPWLLGLSMVCWARCSRHSPWRLSGG